MNPRPAQATNKSLSYDRQTDRQGQREGEARNGRCEGRRRRKRRERKERRKEEMRLLYSQIHKDIEAQKLLPVVT